MQIIHHKRQKHQLTTTNDQPPINELFTTPTYQFPLKTKARKMNLPINSYLH